MPRIFGSRIARKSFWEHARLSSFPVSLGIFFAYALRTLFGDFLGRVPLLKVVNSSISGLIAMHNVAPSLAPSSESRECGFDSHALDQWDLVVVGSGPGGSIVAAGAVEDGDTVLIIEKGTEFNTKIGHHTPEQMKAFFASGGQEIIWGKPLVPFAQGSVLGGGSEINSGLYHRLPEQVAEDWSLKVPLFNQEARRAAEIEVEEKLRISVQEGDTLGVYGNSPIVEMQASLSWAGGVIPRWRSYQNGGFTHHGMTDTYLSNHKNQRAQILVDHEVARLEKAFDSVFIHLEGKRCSHVLKSAKVCLSAGTTQTPNILSRSGLVNIKQLRFGFHAMFREVAEFSRPVNDLHDIDPHQIWADDYGLKIGAAVGTPPLLASTLAAKNIHDKTNWGQLGSYYVSMAATGRGGFWRTSKSLSPWFITDNAFRKKSMSAVSLLRRELEKAGGIPLGPQSLQISTVHIFSSLPLNQSEGVLDDEGFVKGTNNRVFVRDASLMPSAPLVNPQGPLMHLVTALEAKRRRDR